MRSASIFELKVTATRRRTFTSPGTAYTDPDLPDALAADLELLPDTPQNHVQQATAAHKGTPDSTRRCTAGAA